MASSKKFVDESSGADGREEMSGRGKSPVLIDWSTIGQLSGSRNTGTVFSAKEEEEKGAETGGK